MAEQQQQSVQNWCQLQQQQAHEQVVATTTTGETLPPAPAHSDAKTTVKRPKDKSGKNGTNKLSRGEKLLAPLTIPPAAPGPTSPPPPRSSPPNAGSTTTPFFAQDA